jgi:hypothetical protein
VSSPLTWFTDRSRITTEWQCPRKRLLQYHYGGRGVVPPTQGLELFLGSALHDGLAAVATQWQLSKDADIDGIANAASKSVLDGLMADSSGIDEDFQFAKEQAVLIEGILRGFYLYAWPSLISRYPKIVAVEQEMTYPLSDGVVFMSRPDLVLSDDDGNWVYVEYKSTSNKSENWVNQWQTAVQIHSTIKAVEHTLGTAPSSVIVQGLYKGYVSYGKQSSPFCYAYYRQGTPPFSYPEYAYSYKQGFKRSPTWEMEGGVKSWVEGMPEQVLADQFPQTAPIFINNDLVARFFSQRLLREVEIQEALKILNDEKMADMKDQFMDAFFPQRFDQCNPAGFSKPCAYRQICHAGMDPIAMGWPQRVAHHTPEMEQHDAN